MATPCGRREAHRSEPLGTDPDPVVRRGGLGAEDVARNRRTTKGHRWAGQFQQNLPQGRTFQLLRLVLDPAMGMIPEISGNRLMVSIRFMRHGDDDRLHAASDDCPFQLTLCA